ncbi:MAG: serine/threonine-protein kinase [Thermoguttaceae bacterium]
MSWPLASHFSTMLQNPRVAFCDPRLQASSIEKDAQRQPRPWAGAFAVVYKGIDANGRDPFAVRVFTTESPERRERYDHISAYLKNRKPNCLVDFEYRDNSIRSASDGKWYPLIIMEWVQGETLFNWARARCRQGDRRALALAAERWAKLVKELAEASLAHGDLQHANVMVTEAGELKLVDYDCMCVPALVGRRNLEVGVAPYQHPDRNESTLLSLDLDNFSALAIYVALRSLAVEPDLWEKYVEQPGYDKLLFRQQDFQDPSNSPLCRDLKKLPDREVAGLADKLLELWHMHMEQVPPLSHLANSYAKVEKLLLDQDWQEAVDLLNRRGQFRDAPERLQPLIRHAYEHVCRQQAWTSFLRMPQETSEDNDRLLVDAWNEKLFVGDETAERQRYRVSEARKRVNQLDRLCHLVQQSSGMITAGGEHSIVEAAAKLPQGYQYSLLARAKMAQRRSSAIDRLDKALKTASSEAAIVAAWRALVDAKCEKMVKPVTKQRIELAEQRAPVLKTLYAISDDISQKKRLKKIVAAWDDELLADCREADRWRADYEKAVQGKDDKQPPGSGWGLKSLKVFGSKQVEQQSDQQ